MSIKWENLRKPLALCIFFIDKMYCVCNNQDQSKKYSFRSNQNIFIKEDQLNTVLNGYCFCIWCWCWSHQEKNIREERWIRSGGDQGPRITLKDELGPFSLPQISHCNDVSVLWELKEQPAGWLPHASGVRQQRSNMCELPLCLVSCTALLSTETTRLLHFCLPDLCPMLLVSHVNLHHVTE